MAEHFDIYKISTVTREYRWIASLSIVDGRLRVEAANNVIMSMAQEQLKDYGIESLEEIRVKPWARLSGWFPTEIHDDSYCFFAETDSLPLKTRKSSLKLT